MMWVGALVLAAFSLFLGGFLIGRRSRQSPQKVPLFQIRAEEPSIQDLAPGPRVVIPPPFVEPMVTRHSPLTSPLTSPLASPLTSLETSLKQCTTLESTLEAGLDWLAEVSGSSVLFFRYQRGREIALLERVVGFGTDGGMGDSLVLKGLKIPLPQGIENTLLRMANHFEIPSLHRYEPLMRLLQFELGVAFFEAWAITPLPHLHKTAPAFPTAQSTLYTSHSTPQERVKFLAELFGVIVFLQSSSQTALNRKQLLQGMEILAHEIATRPTQELPRFESPYTSFSPSFSTHRSPTL